MSEESVKIADTKAWLAKAAMDLRAAEHERTANPPITGDMVFHAQQLGEKSLEALLAWKDVPFRKTHNLVELGEQCGFLFPNLEPLLKRVAPLTEYAWKFRYPGSPLEPLLQEADDALDVARELLEAILALVPERARP